MGKYGVVRMFFSRKSGTGIKEVKQNNNKKKREEIQGLGWRAAEYGRSTGEQKRYVSKYERLSEIRGVEREVEKIFAASALLGQGQK